MSPDLIAQIRELRYVDGLSCVTVANMFGLNRHTVNGVAPGKPGKIDNTRLRAAFLEFLAAGGKSGPVAYDIGWRDRTHGDSTRLRRALGLTDGFTIKRGRSFRYRQRNIDAETAARIAEVIGVAPWAVGCND